MKVEYAAPAQKCRLYEAVIGRIYGVVNTLGRMAVPLGFYLGGVAYLSSWGNIWFHRPLRWRVASARKASSPLRLQNWPVSLKRRWYWEQVDSIAPEPTGWPKAFPLL